VTCHLPLATCHSIIAVGLSGGVDSAVAAALLQEQGRHIVGVTAIVWPGSRCCSDSAILEAKKVCHQLGIKHYVIDLTKEFKEHVVDNFVDEYLDGRTPNPCTRCNFYIRFGTMMTMIKGQIKKDYQDYDPNNVKIATGHYAQVIMDRGKYLLKEGKDKAKDQSYMLYHLTQEQLGAFLTPLGKLTKKQVRVLAKKFKLSPAERKDSQDACFVDDNYQSFIANYTDNKITPGNFVDTSGKILGRHKGIPFYTIGQRRGLGISAAHPLYVIRIDTSRNEIVLGQKAALSGKELTASEVHWIGTAPAAKSCVECKIRYNTRKAKAIIKQLPGNKVHVSFKRPQFAVTPGQNVVFYKRDVVLGGGIIN
jgi:tRNA-specific 2-thiouridylase